MIIIKDYPAMEKLGAALFNAAVSLKEGLIVFLIGDLGAGKTTLVRGFLHQMGIVGTVKSPTYTLVEPYELATQRVYHFDFYRIHDPQELEFMGIRDYFQNNVYCLIEWPEKALGYLPTPDIEIMIEIADLSRNVTAKARSDRGKNVLQTFYHSTT